MSAASPHRANQRSRRVWSSILHNRRWYAGSIVGGIGETQEMLDFCAGNHIGAEIEIMGAGQINEAYDRVLASDVRYGS